MKFLNPAAWLIGAVVVFACGTCSAQIYKCISRDGKIEFSNTACSSSSAGGQVRVNPNSVDMSGAREQSLSLENAQLRQQLQEQQRAQDYRATQSGRTDAEVRADQSNSYECRKAKEKYEWESTDAKGRRRESDAQRLAMYSACGMTEPTQVNIINAPDRRPAIRPLPSPITSCNSGFCTDANGNVIPNMSR